MINFGAVPANSVLPVFFGSYDGATGASETLSGLAITDIEIYKGVSMTQRSSDAGYVLLDTDGIDIDATTGINAFSIDLGDNTDASFYVVGSFYTVVVSSVTVDGVTVNFVAATFRIVAAEAVAGKPKVDVDAWLGTAVATPTVAGVPEIDMTHIAGATTNVAALATNVDAILTDTGTTLQAELDAIEAAVITNAAGADIAADIIALKADTAAILVDTGTTLDAALAVVDANVDAMLVDTAEIGAAGAGLSAVPWNAAWDAEVQSEVTDALVAYDPPTQAELVSEIDAVQTDIAAVQTDTNDIQARLPAALTGGRIDSSVGAMGAGVITSGALDTTAVDEIWAKAMSDLAAIPGINASIFEGLNFVFEMTKHRVTEDATTLTLFQDDSATPVGTAAVSDDGVTLDRGKIS